MIFLCQYSAHRAPQCANWYRDKARPHQRVAVLEGGFRGWEACNLPVKSLADEPLGKAADELALQIGNDFVLRHATNGTPAPKNQPAQPSQPSTPQGSTPKMMLPASSLRQVPMLFPAAGQQSPARSSFLTPQQQSQAYVPPACPNRVPTVPGVEHFDPRDVYRMLGEGSGMLIDLRGEDRAAGLIEGAVHVPAIDQVPFLTKIPELIQIWRDQPLVVFTCQYSAHRAPQCANWYRSAASPNQRVGILSGGFRGWESLGLPVQSLASSREAAKVFDDMAMQIGTQFVADAQQASPMARPSQTLQHLPAQQRQSTQPQTAPSPTVSPMARGNDFAGVPQALPRPRYVPPHLPNTVPTIKDVEHLEPVDVDEMLRTRPQSCVLVDLRGEDRSAGLIEGAVHEPVIDTVPFTIKVPKLVERWADKELVIFTCQYSAHRAPQCANWFRDAADKKQRVAILRGGFRGWEANGLPVKCLAQGQAARDADEVALNLGVNFVNGCLKGIPGGGFCMPTPDKTAVMASQVQHADPRPVTNPATANTQAPSIPNAVPTIENVENIDPVLVHDLLRNRKCLLVDLRGDDRAAGLIEGAVHEPAIGAVPFPTRVPQLAQKWADQSIVVFTCQYSAHRAPQCANWYRQVASPQQRVGILKGGFRGWEAMGLPVKAAADV